jgi:hypothetical protein
MKTKEQIQDKITVIKKQKRQETAPWKIMYLKGKIESLKWILKR